MKKLEDFFETFDGSGRGVITESQLTDPRRKAAAAEAFSRPPLNMELGKAWRDLHFQEIYVPLCSRGEMELETLSGQIPARLFRVCLHGLFDLDPWFCLGYCLQISPKVSSVLTLIRRICTVNVESLSFALRASSENNRMSGQCQASFGCKV